MSASESWRPTQCAAHQQHAREKSLSLLQPQHSLSQCRATQHSESTTDCVWGRNRRVVNFPGPSLSCSRLPLFSLWSQPPRTEAGYKNNRGQEQEESARHQFQGKLPVSVITRTVFPMVTNERKAQRTELPGVSITTYCALWCSCK